MKRNLTAMGLAVAMCILGAYQTRLYPASGQTSTPTSGPIGSISGRVYVDVDPNGSFGGPDVPLEFPLNLFRIDATGPQPPFLGANSAADGTYNFSELPAGTYELGISIPIPAGCAAPNSPFTWVGDTFTGLSCPGVSLTTPSRTINLAAGENATGVDFPQIPPSYEVTARAWLSGAPLSANNRVAITVGGRSCWDANINQVTTAAAIPVSFYFAVLLPTANPACQNGDLDITIDGRPAGATTSWNRFWRDTLFLPGPRPLNQSSDAFLRSVDLEAPPFLGIRGQAVEAGTVTPETVSSHTGTFVADGTEIRALVGTTLCGSTKTKVLTTPTGGFGGNLFGLIVPPADVKPGCGNADATVSFCVGDYKARQSASGPFSYPAGPATPVTWEPATIANVTLEPTTEPCPVLAAILPPTGGRSSGRGRTLHADQIAELGTILVLAGMSLALAARFRRRVRSSSQ